MRRWTIALLLLLSACVSGLRGLKIRGEGPYDTWQEGTAFIIAPNRLMTAAHVYTPGMAWDVDGHPATWNFGVLADGPEGHADLAVLQADVGGVLVEIGTADPDRDIQILTPRGTLTGRCAGEDLYCVRPRLQHGDSGSPVVQDGKLVGVVWGMASENDGTSGKCVSGRMLHAFLGR